MDSGSVLLSGASTFSMVLMFTAVAALVFFLGIGKNKSRKPQRAPGPRPLPIIGNLGSLQGYEVPYQAFNDLGDKYGPVVGLILGTTPTLVVNDSEHVKEVLITKASQFDNRPNFYRYNHLFNGNRQQSLEFCDWSEVQKIRRKMLYQHTFPRKLTYQHLNNIIADQMKIMVKELQSIQRTDEPIQMKPTLMASCANIFTRYFCSRQFESTDPAFMQMYNNFDKIFMEVNQGYALDFLPFLLPFYGKKLRRMEKITSEVHDFLKTQIVQDRRERWTGEKTDRLDYVESLIEHIEKDLEPKIPWKTAMYGLEDILGGSAANGNFLTSIFALIADTPESQVRIQQEIDYAFAHKPAENRNIIDLSDRNLMPYTDAVVFEALRLFASPIFPHVANQDSSIGGYFVEKDTVVFFNNYNLCMSPKLWDEPEKFKPDRFVKDGQVVKPEHFLPFSVGRRSCMGYKIIQYVSFSIIANVLNHFNIRPPPNNTYDIPVGSLALPKITHPFILSYRT